MPDLFMVSRAHRKCESLTFKGKSVPTGRLNTIIRRHIVSSTFCGALSSFAIATWPILQYVFSTQHRSSWSRTSRSLWHLQSHGTTLRAAGIQKLLLSRGMSGQDRGPELTHHSPKFFAINISVSSFCSKLCSADFLMRGSTVFFLASECCGFQKTLSQEDGESVPLVK